MTDKVFDKLIDSMVMLLRYLLSIVCSLVSQRLSLRLEHCLILILAEWMTVLRIFLHTRAYHLCDSEEGLSFFVDCANCLLQQLVRVSDTRFCATFSCAEPCNASVGHCPIRIVTT